MIEAIPQSFLAVRLLRSHCLYLFVEPLRLVELRESALRSLERTTSERARPAVSEDGLRYAADSNSSGASCCTHHPPDAALTRTRAALRQQHKKEQQQQSPSKSRKGCVTEPSTSHQPPATGEWLRGLLLPEDGDCTTRHCTRAAAAPLLAMRGHGSTPNGSAQAFQLLNGHAFNSWFRRTRETNPTPADKLD